MFKLQSPSKYSFDTIPIEMFLSTAQFLNLSILMPLVLLLFFVSPLPYQQNVSLWGILSSGETKKVTEDEIGWVGRWGLGGAMPFLVKNCWTLSVVWAGTLVNHPSWNEQMHGVSKKNSLKPNAASHNNTSWYTDTEGFLEHSRSGGSLYYKGPALQKIMPVLWGEPLIYVV